MPKLLGWNSELVEIPCSCANPCGWVHRAATGRKVITLVLEPGEPDPTEEWVTPDYLEKTPFAGRYFNQPTGEGNDDTDT